MTLNNNVFVIQKGLMTSNSRLFPLHKGLEIRTVSNCFTKKKLTKEINACLTLVYSVTFNHQQNK